MSHRESFPTHDQLPPSIDVEMYEIPMQRQEVGAQHVSQEAPLAPVAEVSEIPPVPAEAEEEPRFHRTPSSVLKGITEATHPSDVREIANEEERQRLRSPLVGEAMKDMRDQAKAELDARAAKSEAARQRRKEANDQRAKIETDLNNVESQTTYAEVQEREMTAARKAIDKAVNVAKAQGKSSLEIHHLKKSLESDARRAAQDTAAKATKARMDDIAKRGGMKNIDAINKENDAAAKTKAYQDHLGVPSKNTEAKNNQPEWAKLERPANVTYKEWLGMDRKQRAEAVTSASVEKPFDVASMSPADIVIFGEKVASGQQEVTQEQYLALAAAHGPARQKVLENFRSQGFEALQTINEAMKNGEFTPTNPAMLRAFQEAYTAAEAENNASSDTQRIPRAVINAVDPQHPQGPQPSPQRPPRPRPTPHSQQPISNLKPEELDGKAVYPVDADPRTTSLGGRTNEANPQGQGTNGGEVVSSGRTYNQQPVAQNPNRDPNPNTYPDDPDGPPTEPFPVQAVPASFPPAPEAMAPARPRISEIVADMRSKEGRLGIKPSELTNQHFRPSGALGALHEIANSRGLGLESAAGVARQLSDEDLNAVVDHNYQLQFARGANSSGEKPPLTGAKFEAFVRERDKRKNAAAVIDARFDSLGYAKEKDPKINDKGEVEKDRKGNEKTVTRKYQNAERQYREFLGIVPDVDSKGRRLRGYEKPKMKFGSSYERDAYDDKVMAIIKPELFNNIDDARRVSNNLQTSKGRGAFNAVWHSVNPDSYEQAGYF